MNLEQSLQKISEVINKNNYFILFTHSYPDGDALGSLIAFFKMLENLKKKVYMVCNSQMPYQYAFLPYSSLIKKDLSFIDPDTGYTAVFLDCSDKDRIKFNNAFNNKNIICTINIDHHISNTYFADINAVDGTKSAASEIVYILFEKYFNKYMDSEIAVALYTGILTDTGKFQYSNTTRDVHKIISSLIDYDINPSQIYSNIYECEPFNKFKLLEIAFKRTKIFNDDKLIYSYLLEKDFRKLNLPFSANDGIIELLRTANKVKVAALFKEVSRNCFKVSLRASEENVNVSEIAQKLGGGGHKMAAAYTFSGSLKKAVDMLKKSIF